MRSSSKNSSLARPEDMAWQRALTLIFLGVLIAYPGAAEAAASTFGHILCNATKTGSGYSVILGAASFIIGLFLVVRGVLLAKKHAENTNDSQIPKIIAHFAGGACMLSLPSFAGILQRSLVGAGGGAGSNGCAAGSVGKAVSLDVMMQNFVSNIYGPIFALLGMLSIVIGLTFIAKGLLRGAKVGTNAQQGDPKSILTHLIIGAILISMGQMLPDVLGSIFGTGTGVSNMTNYSGIQWSKIAGDGANVDAINKTTRAILAFVQIIGGISFFRGWLIMKAAMEGGQATVNQAIIHIVAGVMAINIDVMISVFSNTFGLDIVAG